MKLSIIVAKSENNVIGDCNRLPWHLPEDLRKFREITMGHPILMGRKTFESIGRVLPGRANLVLTRDPDFYHPGVNIYHDLARLLDAYRNSEELFVIGGETCYRQTMNHADKLYITQLHANFSGDTYFPKLSESEWLETTNEYFPPVADRQYGYSFIQKERI